MAHPSDRERTVSQPIVVMPSGNHVHTVIAGALASALLLARMRVQGELGSVRVEPRPFSQGQWDAWLAGRFTKSVRRVRRDSHMDRFASADAVHQHVQYADARAVAFEPGTPDQWFEGLVRTQVSGLEHDRTEAGPYAEAASPWSDTALVLAVSAYQDNPFVVLDADAVTRMSTGKTTAQLAHALCAWVLSQETDMLLAWLTTPALDLCVDDTAIWPALQVIEDAGLTEVVPGTRTAVLVDRSALQA